MSATRDPYLAPLSILLLLRNMPPMYRPLDIEIQVSIMYARPPGRQDWVFGN